VRRRDKAKLRIARRIILKASALWFLVRAMLAAFGLIVPVPRVEALIVLVALVLLRIEIRWSHEDILLGNLGVSHLAIYAVAAVPVLALEITAGVVGRLLLGPGA
jgi:hypothetical protein